MLLKHAFVRGIVSGRDAEDDDVGPEV